MRRIFKYSLMIFSFFISCESPKPNILIQTELGEIKLELYPEKAPITVENFLTYVDGNHFDHSVFYRVVTLKNQPKNPVKIEVIQGGLFHEEKMKNPIQHETTTKTGVLHKNGVLSMARLEPGTATSEFFICVGDQPELDFGGNRNPDGQGFAAFGKVIEGMDVVKKIHGQPERDQALTPHVKIKTIARIKF